MVNPFYKEQVLDNPKYAASLCRQTNHYKLALKFSKVIHDNCKDATHDIGLTLAGRTTFGMSFVQRVLMLGFNDATRLVGKMEDEGLIRKNKNGYQFDVIK